MGGIFQQNRSDSFFNGFNFVKYLAVPKPQNLKTLAPQPFITLQVVRRGLRVLSAIHFNDQTLLEANEIYDVGIDRLLSPEFMPSDLP